MKRYGPLEVTDGVLVIGDMERRHVGVTSEGPPVSLHQFGGYWERSEEAAQALLDRMISDPEARSFRHPEDVLRALDSASREG